jgi:hypothetical protein
VPAGGPSSADSRERDHTVTDWIGLERLAAWMRRSFSATIDELKLVDCGSLDVLLYCEDDLVAGTAGDVNVDRDR